MRGDRPRGPGSDRQRQLLVRRLAALGIGVVILILLLLGVRGCLDARKERGFENYLSDLSSIIETSDQLSRGFFDRLEEPPNNLTELSLEAEIASDRGTAEQLLQRVEGLDTPDELGEAQAELEQAFELRRDALAGIAEDIPTALGEEGRIDAIDRIAEDMRIFLASDVLFARARGEIEAVLAEQEIAGRVAESEFLRPPVERWLDATQLYPILNTFAADSGACSGVHGVALLSTAIDRTPLTPDVENTVSIGNDTPVLTVEVQNQGEREEREVIVTYTASGGASPIEGEVPIDRLDAQGIEEVEVELPVEDAAAGVPLTLEVEVLPVLCESVVDNNGATYTVSFD